MLTIGITSYKIHTSSTLYDLTVRCLNSVLNQKTTVPFKVLLVDDSSELNDDILSLINTGKIELKKVAWHNLSKSFNLVLRTAFYEHESSAALILNNDIELKDGSVQALIDYMEDYPNRLFITGKEECGHEFYPFSGYLIRNQLFEQIGPFDENLPYSHGDVDYTLRLTKAGFGGGFKVCDGFRLHHEPSSTRKELSKEDMERLERDDNDAVFYMRKKWKINFQPRKNIKSLDSNQ